MSDIMQKLIEKEFREVKIELAKKAIKKGRKLEEVADDFELPLSVVEDIIHGKSVEGFITMGAEHDKEQELDQ